MKWDLNKLYSGFDDPALAADEKKIYALMDEIDAAVASGEPAAKVLRTVIGDMQQATEISNAYGEFVMLTLSADARNEEALRMRETVMRCGMRTQQTASGIARYVGGIEDLEKVIGEDELLREHAFLLRDMAEKARHTIDPAIEGVVLELQLNGGDAFENLRDQLDANHMVPYRGEKLPLSAVRNLAYEADGEVRKAAYEAEIAAYPAMEIPMAACLNAIKGEALTICRLKKYDSLLDMTLAEAHMDRETLDTMLGVIRESLPRFRDILKAKARALGHKNGLPFYDLFAPMGESSRKYTLDEAKELLVDVMGGFSKDLASMIAQAFDERWIDAYPREGKSGGAFCAGSGRTKTSYILTNFDGTLSDVLTLAHELGHAFHNRNLYTRSPLNRRTPMPLAETASTFNEIVFTQSMLEKCDEGTRLQLLDQELTDAVQVIVDIMSRYLFETEVVSRRASQELTPKELCQIMTDAQNKTYGDGLDPAYLHPYMWACKSHYYSTGLHFYNFPYAFGMLFGRGVYALYQKNGPAFEETYKKLLSSTGLATVYDVARSVGIDLHDPAFWRASVESVMKDAELFQRMIP